MSKEMDNRENISKTNSHYEGWNTFCDEHLGGRNGNWSGIDAKRFQIAHEIGWNAAKEFFEREFDVARLKMVSEIQSVLNRQD